MWQGIKCCIMGVLRCAGNVRDCALHCGPAAQMTGKGGGRNQAGKRERGRGEGCGLRLLKASNCRVLGAQAGLGSSCGRLRTTAAQGPTGRLAQGSSAGCCVRSTYILYRKAR